MPLILPKSGAYEYEEKKSKFLAYCAPVESEDEARQVIANIRAEHKSANHNVYAYALGGGGGSTGNPVRFSDDGEPQGTAGMPVLGLFQKTGIIDFVCVVTRYFGGTLLGAGGLVRAYTKAAKGAMEAAGPQEQIFSTVYRVHCEYSQFDKLKYQFNKWGLEILEVNYSDRCEVMVQVRDDLAAPFLLGEFYTFELGS